MGDQAWRRAAWKDPAAEPGGRIRNAILIAGPTASGKSALALELAERDGGVIVNADSMQVYSVLDVLTARPSAGRSRARRISLYGHVHPCIAYSTGAWLRDVHALADERHASTARAADLRRRHRPLFPRAGRRHLGNARHSAHVRDRWRYELDERGRGKLHRILMREDPDGRDARCKPADGQRIVRALEVLEASGRSILDWQARARPAADRPRQRAVHRHRAGPRRARRAHRRRASTA